MTALAEAKLLERCAGAILVLNLIDGISTLALVTAGLAVEANPLMESALAQGPLTFMTAKITLVSLGILFLWRMRRHRFAAVSLIGSMVVYSAVVLYHVGGLLNS